MHQSDWCALGRQSDLGAQLQFANLGWTRWEYTYPYGNISSYKYTDKKLYIIWKIDKSFSEVTLTTTIIHKLYLSHSLTPGVEWEKKMLDPNSLSFHAHKRSIQASLLCDFYCPCDSIILENHLCQITVEKKPNSCMKRKDLTLQQPKRAVIFPTQIFIRPFFIKMPLCHQKWPRYF